VDLHGSSQLVSFHGNQGSLKLNSNNSLSSNLKYTYIMPRTSAASSWLLSACISSKNSKKYKFTPLEPRCCLASYSELVYAWHAQLQNRPICAKIYMYLVILPSVRRNCHMHSLKTTSRVCQFQDIWINILALKQYQPLFSCSC